MKLLGNEKEPRNKTIALRVSETEKKEIEKLATYVCNELGVKPTTSNLLKILLDFCFEENKGEGL